MRFDNQISTINDYWKWSNESFISNIRAQEQYNGNLSSFINNRLIGQLLIKSNLCSFEKLRLNRVNDYELDKYVLIGGDGHYSGNDYVYQFRGLWKNLSELHQIMNDSVYIN